MDIWQNEIQEAAYQFQRALEKKEATVVGVNAFQVDEKLDMERLKVDPSIETQPKRPAGRNESQTGFRQSQRIAYPAGESAHGSESMMPLFIECVENDITLGEITGVLRQVWGEYHAPSWG